MSNAFPEGRRLTDKIDVENDFFALACYIVLSGWLFLPYREQFERFGILDAICPVVAAFGVFFLSRRWMSSWTPSVVAGAVYGFGPYALSFSIYHPLAGVYYAMIPWLFLPAAYWHRFSPPTAIRFLTRGLFTLLPFAVVILLFWVPSQPWAGPYFLMPTTGPLDAKDFQGLVFPLYKVGGEVIFGLYHFPVLLALMGVFVLANVQRIAVLIPFAAGLVLSFLDPVLHVSPIVWAGFAILFLSLLAGLGLQAMLYAGKADSFWIVACAILGAVLAALFGGLALSPLTGRVFELTALLYAVSAGALGIVYFCSRFPLRRPWIKWVLLTGAAAADLIICSRYLVDKLF
jgi:hypothetical protein